MSDITTDFIRATNKIYTKVAAILTHLQVMEGDLKLIREQSVENAHGPHSDPDACEPQDEPNNPRVAPDAVKAGQTSRDENRGDDDKGNSLDRFLKRWKKSLRKPVIQLEIAAVIGLGLYTCETRRTNNLSKEQFRRGEQPYIWITNDKVDIVFVPDPPPEITGHVAWSNNYTNYGRTPAYGVRNEQFMRLGKSQQFERFTHPDESDATQDGPPVPPNKVDYFTVFSATGVTREQFQELMHSDVGISIRVIFHYRSSYGKPMETDMCFTREQTGAIGYCDGNDIKQ